MGSDEGKSEKHRQRGQRGFGLIELMIALTILAVGLTGTLALILSAVSSNARNRNDSGATFLASMVLEQLANQPANQNPTVTLTDCAGNSFTLNTATGGTSVASGGTGATLYTTTTAPTTTQVHDINFTQALSGVPTGYKMSYVTCDSNGTRTTYDVRWNMAFISAYSKQITVGARPLGAQANNNIKLFAPPISLRTVATK